MNKSPSSCVKRAGSVVNISASKTTGDKAVAEDRYPKTVAVGQHTQRGVYMQVTACAR